MIEPDDLPQPSELDSLLRAEPLADLPPGFSTRLSQRLSSVAPGAPPRFRLTCLDVAIPAILSLCLAAMGWVWLALPAPLTALLTAKTWIAIQILSRQLTLWSQDPQSGLVTITIAGGAALLAVGAVPALARRTE